MLMEPFEIPNDTVYRIYALYKPYSMGQFLVASSDVEVYQRFPDAARCACIGTVYKKGNRVEITRLKNPQYILEFEANSAKETL